MTKEWDPGLPFLNSQERQNYRELTAALQEVLDKYTDKESANYHAPHGIAAFCYTYFQHIFLPEMNSSAVAFYKRALQEAVEGVEVEEGEKVSVSLEALGDTFRQTFQLLILIGYAHARAGHSLKDCTCIQSVGDSIEAAMRKGTWEQG